MATTTHLLRKGKNGNVSIFIRYRHGDKYTDFNTGVKVPAEHWNAKKNIINSTKGIKDNKTNKELFKTLTDADNSSNAKIKALIAKINDTASRLSLESKDPDTATVKALIMEKATAQPEQKQELTFLTEFEAFVQEVKPDVTHGTYKHYKVTLTHLTGFLKKRPKTLLNDIGYSEVAAFKRYLNEKAKLSNSTANSHLNRLTKFLDEMLRHGKYKSMDFKELKKHKIDYSQDYLIYLTTAEIKQIRELKLKTGSRLDKVRDILLMACSTGLRFSDVMRLSKERIKNDSIHIVTQKNTKNIKIPLFLFAREILEKYDYELPVISNQKMNAYVKELCQKAKINEGIILDKYKGKRTKGEAFEKWELVSSHTGKKTFIMLNVEAGTPIHILSEITGNTIETLKHYYRITDEIKRKYLSDVERAFMKVS